MGLLQDEDLPLKKGEGLSKEGIAPKIIRVRTAGTTNAPSASPAEDHPAQPVSGEMDSPAAIAPIMDENATAPSATHKPLFGRLRKNSGDGENTTPKKISRNTKKISDFERAAKSGQPIRIPLKYRLKPNVGLLRKAAWDIASIGSLLLNVVLLTVIVLLAMQVKSLKGTVNHLVSGLYDNFVALDESVISTTLTLPEMYIPLNFTLNVNQPNTHVTLTENVTIRNAYVVINTDAIKINSTAVVTLPAGTILPVSLNMDVPVQTTIPLNLSIPVVIKLSESNPAGDQQTGLHDAFLGLQNTLGPFYCLMNPDVIQGGDYTCQQGDYLPKQVNP